MSGSLAESTETTLKPKVARKKYPENTTFKDQVSKDNDNKKSLTRTQSLLCGLVAGLTSRAVTSPLDVIKIRLQLEVHKNQHYRGLIHGLRTIVKEEGAKALFKGNLTADLLYASYGSVQFFVYNEWRQFHNNKMGITEGFYGGALAAFAATIITYPLDLMRTRLSAQSEPKVYKSLSHGIRMIHKAHGFIGFYRGLVPNLMQILPYMSAQFALYENFVSILKTKREGKRSAFDHAIAGALAGAGGKMLVIPLDVVKKRVQVEGFIGAHGLHGKTYGNPLSCFKTILREEGVSGLYKGGVPTVFKAICASAATFVSFEEMSSFFVKRNSST